MKFIEQSAHYLREMQIIAARSESKPVARQVTEAAILFLYCGLGPGYYLAARMYAIDYRFNDIFGFLSQRKYEKAIYTINDPLYHRSSQHKAIEKAILTTYRIPTPELLGYFHKVHGRSVDGDRLCSAEQLKSFLDRYTNCETLCIKHAHGWGGHGFHIIERQSDGILLDIGAKKSGTFEEFYEGLECPDEEGLIIERCINQHPAYAAMNESSVNTCRVLAKRNFRGSARCLGSYLRVGRAGTLVDNGEQGGVICPIDRDTGELLAGEIPRDKRPSQLYSVHPDSGHPITGFVLPEYHKAVALALEAVAAFPGVHFAAVDIGMTTNGPVVIELNIWPTYPAFAYTRVPSRTALHGESL